MDARLVAGEHSWTNRSSLEPKNLLIVPGDLVRLVTAALKIPLTPSERQRVDATPTRDPEAYDAYLNGKFNGIQVDESHNRAAIAMFERAVARDPNFAIAHAELGRVYANRLSILRPNEKELEAKAKRAIDRALFLDPKLPEAHTALGQLLWSPFHQFDHEGALVEFLKALDADPESDDAQLWLNLTLGHIGLLEEEVQLATRMTLVNPLSPRGYWLKGLAQTDQRKYAAALQSMSRAQSEHWIPALGEWLKACCHFELGHTNEAREIIEASKAKFPDDYGGIFGSLQAMIYAKAGATAQAEAEIAKAIKHKERFIHFHHTAYQIASAYALMNNTKEGVRWFRELVNDGFNSYPFFRDDPNINSLRDDKEFNDLLDAEKEKYNHFKTKFGIGSPAWEHLQRKSK